MLGARVAFGNAMLTFLTDDEHHRIAIANVPSIEPPAHFNAGVDHTDGPA